MNQTISVSVFDSEGNPFTGAVDVVVSLTQGGNSAPVTNLNNASGVYNFQFVLFQAVAWTPSVLINGSAISSANGVPDVIQVLSGPVVPSASQIVYGGTPIQYVAGTNGGVVTILQAKDQVRGRKCLEFGFCFSIVLKSMETCNLQMSILFGP